MNFSLWLLKVYIIYLDIPPPVCVDDDGRILYAVSRADVEEEEDRLDDELGELHEDVVVVVVDAVVTHVWACH